MSLYFAYHKSGLRMLANEEEYAELIASKQWFSTPLDAEKAANEEIESHKKNSKKREKRKCRIVTCM